MASKKSMKDSSKPSSRNEKKRSNAKFAKARRQNKGGGSKGRKSILSVGQDLGAFPSLGKIDYELIAVGLTPIAVWNTTLKGWSVLYVNESEASADMARGLPLHLAVQKLPTQAEKQEALRQKRNYAAWRRLAPSIRERVNDPRESSSQSDWWDTLGEETRSLIIAAQSAMKSSAKKKSR